MYPLAGLVHLDVNGERCFDDVAVAFTHNVIVNVVGFNNNDHGIVIFVVCDLVNFIPCWFPLAIGLPFEGTSTMNQAQSD